LAIIRKVLVTGAERPLDKKGKELGSTILDVAVVDHNTADPPASLQVGQSVTIEVEDDPSYEGATLEDWFEMFLEDVRVLILQEVAVKDLDGIYQERFAHHG